ncbi:MAG: translocation/assembly module TamB domain-containing protein [Sphingomonadaceae bacterium]
MAATARRVTGLNAAAGGLLTRLSANGDVAWSNGRLLTDNLRLRSERIDATAIAVADFNTGRYTGALKGRVNDYQIDGLGRVNVVTDASLVTDARGCFGIAGVARVVTRRLTNATIADQLAGNATTIARFGFDGDGVIRVRNLRLTSPGLAVVDGSGSYRPDGQIDFRARGRSRSYGPLTVSATGSLARPRVRLVADSPGFGLGLRRVTADLVGTPAGYAVTSRGDSNYGPFSADVLIRTGRGPLTIDIARGRVAGIDVRGRVIQSVSGPYAGTLALAGSGITGQVTLGAAGTVQRADFVLNATGGRIPGDQAISIGGGTVRGTALLYPDAPAINADFRLANLVQGDVLLSQAQGRVRYQNGRGTAAVVARGQTNTPFDLAAQAAFAPDRIVANAKGSANGIAFSLANPAAVTRSNGAWSLQPVTIIIPQGRVQLSGAYGNEITARAALDNVDLAIVQAFASGLGLGGKASGTIDYVQGGTTTARLTVQRFTRTAAYSVSPPVDIALLALIDRRGGDIRAVVRRGSGVIGRLQARLAGQPLMRAGLAGGIRYGGPAEVLWALTGIADQQLGGPIVVAADFGGTVDRPTLTGLVRGDALRYENQTYGTVITNLAIAGRFNQSELQLTSMQGRAGRGTISGTGTIGLDAAGNFPADLKLSFANAQLASSSALGATVSGTLAIVNGPSGGRISGELQVPDARYEFIRAGTAEVAALSGVRRKSAVDDPRGVRPAAAPAFATNFALDIRLRADNRIFVSGMGLEAEWATDMRVTGTAAVPRVIGNLEIVRGTYSFAGRRFDLDDSGRLTFDGGAFTNPQIALVARTSVEGVSATITIAGRAQNPQIGFSSTPSLPQDEVLSRLLFGSSITELTPVQAIQLAAALNSLRGAGGGLDPLGKLRSAAGISRLRVLGEDKSLNRGTALAVGQYISNNIYVEVITDARGFTATQIEIGLSRALSLLSATSSFGGSSATLRYSRDY